MFDPFLTLYIGIDNSCGSLASASFASYEFTQMAVIQMGVEQMQNGNLTANLARMASLASLSNSAKVG